ncbi:hypothetical protein TNIN_385271 [Trichonephila inaurata madagascariensis]|uniref:Uncharacterized protein n=1 Tax=Trichonephila inaurata madagascariensis TaxID=2747483 RepID=A0A8X6YNL8_9ARAC|nr:hypothetical protein TNIN_385271 [Trichonephila inaurata madagascariensis]
MKFIEEWTNYTTGRRQSGVNEDFNVGFLIIQNLVMSIRRTKLLLWRRLNFGCLLKNISLILQAEDLLMKRTNRFDFNNREIYVLLAIKIKNRNPRKELFRMNRVLSSIGDMGIGVQGVKLLKANTLQPLVEWFSLKVGALWSEECFPGILWVHSPLWKAR